jgi:flagellar hook protein FlgE
MTISSALNAGVTGLKANAVRLATISDNIANSATFGYKRAGADFHSMVVNAGGSGTGAYSAGGVRTTTHRLIDERGALSASTNSTDIAVSGRGFFPVTSSAAVKAGDGPLPMMLMTSGSFRTDAEGYLRTPTGEVLMGWPVNPDGTVPPFARDSSTGLAPVQINANEFISEPTQNIQLGVNLPATATVGTEQFLSVEYYGNLGSSERLDAIFTKTANANEWSMEITDSLSGNVIGAYTLQFSASAGTGGTLTSITSADPALYPDPPPGSGLLALAVGTPPATGGPMNIDLGLIGDPGGLTQLGDAFAPGTIAKDGAPVGSLVQVEVDQNGFLVALYDVGVTRRLYQIPLADVPNPNGLQAMDNQTYRVTNASGSFFLWDAGAGPTGSIEGYVREESTTDVAQELTQLIQTQRAYSSNAKVIQTVDEMLQETTNIKR